MRAFLLCLMLQAAFAKIPEFILFTPEEAAAMRTAPGLDRLRQAADAALKEGPWSVTFHRPKGTPAGPHDFFSEGPYWWPDPKNPNGPYVRRDGVVNPDRFVENDNDLSHMGETILRLGSAAYFFGDERYAKRAAEVLRTWFLDEKTYMNPNLEFGQAIRNINFGRGIGIIDTRPFIWVVQGVAFLEHSPGWDGRVSDGLRKWFKSYNEWLTTSKKGLDEKTNGNNHSTWWAAQVGSYAAFTRDEKTLSSVWEFYREYLVPHQLQPDGSAPAEEARTKSLGYSSMNLEGFTMLCRLAQNSGVNLWKFSTPKSGSVEKAVAYLAPFVRNPDTWKKPQISPYKAGGTYFLGLAGIGLGVPEYVDAQVRLGASRGPWGDLLALLLARR